MNNQPSAVNRPAITNKHGIVYEQPMATVIMITLDRSELTERITRRNIAICGIPRERLQIIIIDNNSTEFDIIEFGAHYADIHIANSVNVGVAKAQNMGLVRALGTCVCLMGNDIEMPANWLVKAMQATTHPSAGLIGIDCLGKADGNYQLVNGIAVNGGDVFGTVVFYRERILSLVGYLCNAYGAYGLEDSDYSYRIQQAGLSNYYLHGMTSNHAAPDVGQDTEYRRGKDASLQANADVFGEMQQWYAERGVYLPASNCGFDAMLGWYTSDSN
jgi:GT2 family glycosyltransferase